MMRMTTTKTRTRMMKRIEVDSVDMFAVYQAKVHLSLIKLISKVPQALSQVPLDIPKSWRGRAT